MNTHPQVASSDFEKALLEKRTRLLSTRSDPGSRALEKKVSLITFTVKDQTYAVRTLSVLGIRPAKGITESADQSHLGLLGFQGEVWSVVSWNESEGVGAQVRFDSNGYAILLKASKIALYAERLGALVTVSESDIDVKEKNLGVGTKKLALESNSLLFLEAKDLVESLRMIKEES